MITTILDHFNLTPHDFALQTEWKTGGISGPIYGIRDVLIDEKGKKWRYMGHLSGDRFYNLLHFVTNPLFHGIAIVGIVAYRILRIITLYPLFAEQKEPRSLNQRAVALGIETLQVLSSPFLLVALEVAALYGI